MTRIYRLVIEQLAESDIAEAYQWYKSTNSELPDNFRAAMRKIYGRII